MCGIVGFIGGDTFRDENKLKKTLSNMSAQIFSRGPDSSGIWYDLDSKVGFAHRRLSILELSIAGHQPMSSHSGRYVIIFNGEIYNHQILRRELNDNSSGKKQWRGRSDTETLLESIEVWGVEKTLKKANGMFALALWDNKNKHLYLARDRLGEKPLYYGWSNNVFLFGSELKALKKHPSFDQSLDRDSLAKLFRFNYIPAPLSIYKNFKKLLPGTFLKLDLKKLKSSQLAKQKPKAYWSFLSIVSRGLDEPFQGSEVEAIDCTHKILFDAVGQQMLADVSLGAFLSGGIDSSTIVALMQAQSSKPVKTFSIGFDEKSYNEAHYAKMVANHLGTDHTELYISSQNALEVIPKIPSLYDEPFSDSSQIPTFLISEMTRKHVKVALSGDGGDELFCGYNRYSFTNNIWRYLEKFPIFSRKFAKNFIQSVSPQKWDKLIYPFLRLNSNLSSFDNFGDKLHKGSKILLSNSSRELYASLISHWEEIDNLVFDTSSNFATDHRKYPADFSLNAIEDMMVNDTLTYLTDDILVKVDRAAMGVSLETRIPFLDRDVIEFAWTLPFDLKLKKNEGKWILKKVLDKYLPRSLVDRPKMGFGIPLGEWLRGPLKDWAAALIDKDRLKREGLLNSYQIHEKWEQHLSGQRNWEYHLWDILMFQAWLENQ